MKKLSLLVEDWLRRFRAADYNTKGLICGIFALLAISLVLRFSVISAQTSDYIYFVDSWLSYLRTHGIYGFHDNFANYNTPYLFLLWLSGYLYFPDIVTIKAISILFDLIMAYGAVLVVGYYRPAGLTKYFAGIAVLYLPTVFINSSLWGQCDSIYTAFLLFAFYACLKNQAHLAWLWWGVAFAFKLQAIFFLPFLVFMTLRKRWKSWNILFAVVVFAMLSLMPVLEGRSIASTLSIYVDQTKSPVGHLELAINAPTFYQWLPTHYYLTYFKRAGTIFAAGVALAIVMLAFRDHKGTNHKYDSLIIACLSLFALPFFLPLIHERYFYSAEVFSLVLAFVIPRLAYIAVTMQVVTLLSYIPYLSWDSQAPPIPYSVMSLAVLAIIGILSREALKTKPGY